MNLPQLIDFLSSKKDFFQNITIWKTIPASSESRSPFPDTIPDNIKEVLRKKGISSLYTHQATAFERIIAGENVVIVTPTASGKTLSYNLPILTTLLDQPEIRTLYLFPTKALAQDQVHELQDLIDRLGEKIICHTFDGDTPPEVRRTIRAAGHIVVTNPDKIV
jgi:DEAD/DEAH box helicase domain-containing protein